MSDPGNPDPGTSDSGTSDPVGSNAGIEQLRGDIDEINERLLELIAERQEVSLAIGSLKAQQGLPLYSHEREAQLLEKFRTDALRYDLDPDYVEELMNVVLRHSRAAQRKRVDADPSLGT